MSTEVLKRCLCSHHLEPWSPANDVKRQPLAAASLKLSMNAKGVEGRSRGRESLPKSKNQRGCDSITLTDLTGHSGNRKGVCCYKSGRPARKESVLVLGPHTQRLPPREVPGSSSDTCWGRALDPIDTEHLRLRNPGDAGEMERSAAPSLSKAECIHVQVHELRTGLGCCAALRWSPWLHICTFLLFGHLSTNDSHWSRAERLPFKRNSIISQQLRIQGGAVWKHAAAKGAVIASPGRAAPGRVNSTPTGPSRTQNAPTEARPTERERLPPSLSSPSQSEENVFPKLFLLRCPGLSPSERSKVVDIKKFSSWNLCPSNQPSRNPTPKPLL